MTYVENGNPLQCSCLENPRDRGASWASVYGVAWSRTWLKRLSSSSSSSRYISKTESTLFSSVHVWSWWKEGAKNGIVVWAWETISSEYYGAGQAGAGAPAGRVEAESHGCGPCWQRGISQTSQWRWQVGRWRRKYQVVSLSTIPFTKLGLRKQKSIKTIHVVKNLWTLYSQPSITSV